MTDEQKQTVRAFGDWLKENKISHMMLTSDSKDNILVMNGERAHIGAAISLCLVKDDDFRKLVQQASAVAALGAIMCNKGDGNGQGEG